MARVTMLMEDGRQMEFDAIVFCGINNIGIAQTGQTTGMYGNFSFTDLAIIKWKLDKSLEEEIEKHIDRTSSQWE